VFQPTHSPSMSFGDVEAEAVLQKLYRDNGTVVERFYVAFASNITSRAYTPPKPKIVMYGEEVNIYTPQEVLDGDYRYVFLYWSGPEGLRIDTPSATIKVNKEHDAGSKLLHLQEVPRRILPNTHIRKTQLSQT
jgi:hypothetical protein